MARKDGTGKHGLLQAARDVLLRTGAGGLTVDAVAREAGAAKGLVHYHFGSRDRLLSAVLTEMATTRESAWRAAFDAPTVPEAIDRTWALLREEGASGMTRALVTAHSQSSELTGRTVKDTAAGFAKTVARGARDLLERLGHTPPLPMEELGWLLAAVIQGAALQLLSGADPDTVENGFAAAWLGVLALSRGG